MWLCALAPEHPLAVPIAPARLPTIPTAPERAFAPLNTMHSKTMTHSDRTPVPCICALCARSLQPLAA